MGIKICNTDWSGVMSNDIEPVYEANMRVLETHGISRSPFEEWLPTTFVFSTSAEFLRDRGIKGDDDSLYELYKKELNNVVGEGILPTIYPDSYEVLEYLKEKGIILNVISGHPEQNLLDEIERYGLNGIFYTVKGSCTDKARILKEISRQFGVTPESSIYLGDMCFDIRAAKQAGCISAAVLGGYHTKEKLVDENPDIILDSLLDLKSIIF